MRTTAIFSSLTWLALAGCGGASITPELRTARDTIDQARSGRAALLEPEQVRRAELALAAAEDAPDGSALERDLAYIADRQARIAMADASIADVDTALEVEQREYQRELEQAAIDRGSARQEQQIAALQRELSVVLGELAEVRGELDRRGRTLDARTRTLQRRELELALRELALAGVLAESRATTAELREARRELESVRRELAVVRGRLEQRSRTMEPRMHELELRERELALREEELRQSVVARARAELRADEAMRDVEELAAVRRAEDEVVITLPADVLFEHEQPELRPAGRERLRAVASALAAQPDARVVIESHMDARGSAQRSDQLAARRAEVVRQFLVEEGVDMGRLRAVGRGARDPIASNDTVEGRADNRRVEIHVRPAEGAITAAR